MKITLTGAPQSTNHLYKPSCKYGHPSIYMTHEAEKLKLDYQWEAKAQWRRPVFDGDVRVAICLYFPDNRRRDWDNWHKISMDSLTGIVWVDDSQIVEAKVVKAIDKKNPRIEIIIS